MDACHFLLIVLVAAILHVAYATAATTSVNLTADAAAMAYDILEKNNLPRGLLPKGVQSYNLNLDGKIEFRFASTVGGVIQAGSIHEVYGVRVQIKFGWLGIRQVDRAGDQLTLQVQQFTQKFPTSAFAVSPSCS
uniref:Uncharacterized protein n=1 Tax=Setaria italica TaxID=4555 RepID=K3YEF6_SETIT